MGRFRFIRPALASIVSGATLVAYTGLSVPVAPARAADPATADVIAGLNQTIDFIDSVGAVGALAQDLPGLALAPGSAAGIGLADLLAKGRDTLLGGTTYGGVDTLSALVSKIDDVDNGSLGDGRTLDLTAADQDAGTLHTITVGLTAKRSIDTGVDVASTSPKFAFTAAKGITAALTLSGSFTILYDTATRYFRLAKTTSSPSLDLTVATSIPDVSKVTAGLGILGVRLGDGSTFDLSATLRAAFDDPDSDGVLAFSAPDGAGGFRDAELAAAGAGAGVTGVALTSGTLTSTLNLQAVPSDYINLGAAAATVTVGSPNLVTTPITVTDTGGTLGAVNNFLNLSPRDLAQGLAEIATTITALQRAGGIDLPFLRGGIDDAVKSTEAIVEFLDKHVAKATDPTTPGRPDFASLQDLLKELVDANTLPSGADFTVANGTYDGAKVRFDLGISRTSTAAQPMNALGQATSGSGAGVTYTATTLKDPGQDFSDQAGEALSYKGRQVLVGASSAIIASASGDTLTLDPSALGSPPPANAWKGGTPADGTAYSISAGDPRTGLVELGNVLGAAGAVKNANAKTAVASVTPSYSVTLPIVLDLRPGSTTDCDPGPGTAACPFQLKDPSTGLATVITELPLAPDRIMLNTGRPLLTADAPVTSKVDVDATVGFVGVKITGDLAMCTTSAPADCTGTPASTDHLLTLGLKAMGDAGNDATLPQIGKALTAALSGGSLSDVITSSVKGQAYAALKVDVPGADGFFGSAPASVTVTLPDITNPAGVSVSAPDLAKLRPLDFDPSNPLALFGVLLADLQGLQDTIGDLPGGSAGLKTPIPLVGRSLSDLIGSGVSGAGAGVTYGATTLTDTNRTFDNSFLGRRVTVGTTTAVVLGGSGDTLTLSPWNATPAAGAPYQIDSEIQGVVNLLTAAQPPSLQDALALLKNGLGIDTGPGEALGFTVDTSGTDPVLKLNIDWVRSAQKTLPINLSFKLGSTDRSLIGADTGGVLKATVGGAVKLGLQLPLTTAAAAAPLTYLRVDPTSSITASASLTGDGLRLATNIGPFQISLGDPNTANDAGTQLEAKFGVALKDSTDTAPVTLSQFAGNLALTMDNGTVTCPGASSTAALSACAVLPVYLNGSPISASDNAFVLRLPKDATDLADAFSLSGDIESGTPRFSYPPDLASKLAAAGLNMLTVGDGLFGYVQFLENALQVASFDGKLPVIGKDLQAGSKFLGDLRTGLQSAFAGAPTNPTAGDIKTFLNDKVRPALPGAPNPLPVTFQCEVYLSTPSAPGAVARATDTHSPAPTLIDYFYKVVATVNTPPEDGIPSDASSVVKNEATLNASHYNDVSWAAVKYATGYKILRKRGAESTFTQVGTSTTTTFKDVAAAGTSYTAATSNPKLKDCPDDAPADSVTGFTVTVDIGQGNPTAGAGCTAPGCLDGAMPLDLGIPGLSFKASDAADDKVKASLGWKLHLQFGMSRDAGFFVSTQDTTAPEFTVGTSVDLPANMQAQLAFFNIDIAKHAGSEATPLFKGAFTIDLKDKATSPDCPGSSCSAADDSRRLTLDTLKASSLGDLVVPKLTAGVNIDWDVKATVDSALPGVGARFLLKWDWTSDDPGNVTNLSQLAFKDVVIDPGQFIESNIGPIVNQLISVFKPVQPIIDTILAPLPVLSDLSKLAGGDDVTIASLAQTFSTVAGGPDITPFIEVLKVIRSLGGLAGTCSGGTTFCVKVGDFDIKKDLALRTANSAATASALVGSNTPAPGDNPFKQLSDSAGGKLAAATGPALAQSACPNGKRGISFPALEQPTQLFGLLLNQDVEIACFDSGPLTLGFEMNLRLGPVYAPPPVYIVISGGASVSLRLAAGFDTYGIRTAVEQGKLTANILDSIYFKTTDTTGAPLPVVQFKGFLAAGASVSAVIIEVGIKGGIELTVTFTWNDPNNDGKFRFNEFLATALNNPICLFNVGGQLDLFITVFVTLGISPFSVSFDFELVRVKLLDFSLKPDCTPPPPRLGGTKDGVLYLFAGKYGGTSERGNAAWKSNNTADEGWIVRQVPDDPATTSTDERAVVVQALGITETFPDAGGTAITAVVLDGRGYDGKLKVVFNGGGKDQPFDKDTIVFTGNKSDTVRTGSGQSFVDAGGGDDNVSTTDRPVLAVPRAASSRAVVAGGGGKDGITVGNGDDVVLGDGALTPSTGTVTVTSLTGATVTLTGAIKVSPLPAASSPSSQSSGDDADTISAGLGSNQIWGGGGADIIGTANDSPLAQIPANASTKSRYQAQPNTIVGGSGSDRIKSGSAADSIYTGSKVDPGKDGDGAGDAVDAVNTVDTGTGSDTVYGSSGQDNVATGSLADQSAKVYGGGANDILAGGDGTDELYGGPGDDYVIAEPSTVQTSPTVPDVLGNAYVVTRLNRLSSNSTKTLAGGGGRDRIYGGNGTALIYGDRADFTCAKGTDPVSDAPTESPTVSSPANPAVDDAADLILGGNGVDTVNAGGGNDTVYAAGGNDLLCGNAGDDRISSGSGDDYAYGGSGNDTEYGDGGIDFVFGNTGADTVYGGAGDDVLEGNADSDTAFGGTGDDTVVGGTRKAGRDDAGDTLYGDAGTDVLIGDNGVPGALYDLDAGDSSLGGKDLLYAGAGDDRGYGGLDADEVHGGDGADQLEGNNASDTVYGEAGADNIIGGTSQTAGGGATYPDAGDTLSGGGDDDVIAGDNAQLANVSSGSPLTKGRGLTSERAITLLDLGTGSATGKYGGDTVTGDAGTDVVLGQRGNDVINGNAGDDYLEGGQDSDTISGDTGADDIVGGEFTPASGSGASTVGQLDAGDTISGGDASDVVLGDNGALLRDPAVPTSDLTKGRGITERAIALYDLGDAPTAGTSGADVVNGDAAVDVVLGQGDTDRLLGGDASDYVEGGPAADWIEGGNGSDDLVGGSSTIKSGTGEAAQGQPDAGDVLWGQAGDDVQTGDNAVVTRVAPYNDLTFRISGGAFTERRAIRLLDVSNAGANSSGVLNAPAATRFGDDQLSGQGDVDVLLGQDGADRISGGSGADYAEGQGGADGIWGDQSLASAGVTLPLVDWPGAASTGYDADGGAAGQDDLIGGKSQPGFRDSGDLINGNGESDYALGDNGTSVRDIKAGTATVTPSTSPLPTGPYTERVYTVRYPASLPAGAALVRHRDPAQSAPTTRYCTSSQVTCEVAGAFGDDTILGEGGDDFLYGQDGNDTIRGGDGDDDVFGELGNDVLYGDAGNDAILGDRGGVRDVYQSGGNAFFMSVTQVPKVEYTGFAAGTVTRVTDLLHDVDGDVFVGSGTQPAMPHAGLNEGGDDRIRGGTGNDAIHAGFGDDLANGDSGGDSVLGDDGADVLWGGKGCDATVDTPSSAPYCYPGGVFDPAPHNAAGETVPQVTDYVLGGKGGTSAASLAGSNGSDILDWRPRGSYVPGTGCTTSAWPVDLQTGGKKGTTTTVDPCSWFEMTNLDTPSDSDNQHHQGVDWQYGGWDRDILQADVADNGPNEGDRLLDWNGAYNLYTHCNSAYGGFNDVRQHSPAWQDFLQRWVWAQGAGQAQSDATTAGTSAFVELALVYPGADNAHGSGSAYPSTPGHFDNPNACAP